MDMKFISMAFKPSFAETVTALNIDSEMEDEFRDIFDQCVAVARPKAVFCLVPAHQEEGETVIGAERFKSRIMRVNLEKVRRVFPYAVTCGRELYDLAQSTPDPLERWWIDCFSQYSMRAVDAEMTRILKESYHLGHTARMNPGSLPDFPITCQKALFRLLEDGPDQIGLELTQSCLMLPYKSVSGFVYETEATFENCMLCPRENCPTRRAAYDSDLGESTYHLSGADSEARAGV